MLKYGKLSRYKILKIVECFCLDLTATQTKSILGINRNTINRFFMLFRKLILQHQSIEFGAMIGEVELDGCYFGPNRIRGVPGHKRGRGTSRQPVFGIFERNGRVYTEIIPHTGKTVLREIITGKMDPQSVIYSDGWRGYDGLVDVGYDKHYRINKKYEGFKSGKGVHINGIESFWSFVKRRLGKFNGVKSHFDLHLKECEWRWKKPQEQMNKELCKLLVKYGKQDFPHFNYLNDKSEN